MGSCFCTRTGKEREIVCNHTYFRQVMLGIKRKDSQGRVFSVDQVYFQLTEPALAESNKLEVGNKEFWVSRCIIPGMDPRNIKHKECQDFCGYITDECSILVSLFDGHGKQGKKVTQFCDRIVKKKFQEWEYYQDPQEFLNRVIIQCDSLIKSTDCDINTVYSGTTSVLVYIKQDQMYCASVGDSRAILSTFDFQAQSPAPLVRIGSDKEILQNLRERNSTLTSPLKVLQLSQDQKPNDPHQLTRIVSYGGRVQKGVDRDGNNIGPFRVWEKNRQSPGLALSRSIGDQVGSELGVISTPIIKKHKISRNDQFLVVASDGMWDVFENEEVVNFVQTYRRQCCRCLKKPPMTHLVSAENSCIAQLLCEEARYRWYTIIEEEDMLIDDISCVVVEFNDEIVSENFQRSFRQEEAKVGTKPIYENVLS